MSVEEPDDDMIPLAEYIADPKLGDYKALGHTLMRWKGRGYVLVTPEV
jgi:hypothetical protein